MQPKEEGVRFGDKVLFLQTSPTSTRHDRLSVSRLASRMSRDSLLKSKTKRHCYCKAADSADPTTRAERMWEVEGKKANQERTTIVRNR